jgi:ATP-dependent RNA helicase RhlE
MDFSICKAYGGVSLNPQIKILANGVDILVATPGRLLDLFAQKKLNFGGVEYLVLDEADRMLDMGFIKDIKKICTALPKERQSMLFSATLSNEIEALAKGIVRNPERISVSPDKPTVEKIAQKIAFIELENKFALLEKMMKARISKQDNSLALIFCRTKHGANKLAKRLCRIGLTADAIHGNKSQSLYLCYSCGFSACSSYFNCLHYYKRIPVVWKNAN